MILVIISIALYLFVGVMLAFYISMEEKNMDAWEWFWIIVAWLPAVVAITIEWIVELLRRFIK